MEEERNRVLNINVGVLGHVDSGKTSLTRSLATKFSTASLDKHPESKLRGITLDLGFSAFRVPVPAHLQDDAQGFDSLQYTLIDCPGHASLIRTIIGGAQIMDMMILVIDVLRGIQTQTAECLVIGSITCENAIIVLNKIDLIDEAERDARVEKTKKNIRKAIAKTKFADAPIVAISASVGGAGKSVGESVALAKQQGGSGASAGAGGGTADASGSDTSKLPSLGIPELVDAVTAATFVPKRVISDTVPMLYMVDHCFSVRGQGTVLTGTVLQGTMSLGQGIEIPSLGVQKKIKSIEMFRTNVKKAIQVSSSTMGIGQAAVCSTIATAGRPRRVARALVLSSGICARVVLAMPCVYAWQGDRVGVCVAGLNSKLLERAIICTPGSVNLVSKAIALVKRVRYFRGACRSRSIFHITVGHKTVLATATFFGAAEGVGEPVRRCVALCVPKHQNMSHRARVVDEGDLLARCRSIARRTTLHSAGICRTSRSTRSESTIGKMSFSSRRLGAAMVTKTTLRQGVVGAADVAKDVGVDGVVVPVVAAAERPVLACV